MAWWQKKLLHYALSRTGLLDDKAIDPENLDITLGRTNVVELKDVGLNIERISKLAQLPPSLRVETAKVLSLRLTVPANIYQSSIVAEVDGVDLSIRTVGSKDDGPAPKTKYKSSSPPHVSSPQHRKVHRRIHSPPPYDPGGLSRSDDDLHVPTPAEVARSFLQDEPLHERRELEATVALDKSMEESAFSESSASDDVGTGAGVGLPGFLAGFLQGIVDRLKLHLKDVQIRLVSEVTGDGQDAVPITLKLRVGTAELEQLEGNEQSERAGRRHVKLQDISMDLLSDAATFSVLSELPSRGPPSEKRSPSCDRSSSDARSQTSPRTGTPGTQSNVSNKAPSLSSPFQPELVNRLQNASQDRVNDSEVVCSPPESMTSDQDIQPGDDNISWTSRRSKSGSSGPTEDLWNSMASEDDLPDSMLLERAATPRPLLSRDSSPITARTRRAVSPYDRAVQSPGSWPKLQDNLDRRRASASPAAMPETFHSRRSMFQPLTPGPASEQKEDPMENNMDNKRAALEAYRNAYQTYPSDAVDYDDLETPPEPEGDALEAMAQSRFYSHEDAHSLYESALAHSTKMHVPGGWGNESTLSEPAQEQNRFDLDGGVIGTEALAEGPGYRSGNATPRAQSPELERKDDRADDMTAKRLIAVDEISVWLPLASSDASSTPDAATAQQNVRSPAVSGQRGMPGSFSLHSEMATPQGRGASSSSDGKRSTQLPLSKPSIASSTAFEINIGSVACSIDVPACRLLHCIGTIITGSLATTNGPSNGKGERRALESSAAVQGALKIKDLSLTLLEELPLVGVEAKDVSLLALISKDLQLKAGSGEVDLRVGRLKALLSGSELLNFDRTAKMSSSVVLTESTPDVTVLINNNRTTAAGRPVSDYSIETLVARLELDLSAIDDTLSSFGGLSGVLELSGSLLSEPGSATSPNAASKSAKGVRFQGDPIDTPVTKPEYKLNARIGGSDLTLRGDACALNLRTTTIKAVYREQGTIATIEHVILAGPYSTQSTSPPVTVDLSALRLEFLVSPGDRDLERLLSLLTPSGDKYDTDDDILLDTLIRQRRKGSLGRVAIGNVKVNLVDLDFQPALAALGSELHKLSAVVKYLPEDDRPGLLTLVRAKEFEAQLPVNDRFGKLQVLSHDFHLAYVGLPALLAFSIGTFNANRMGDAELVHPMIPPSATDNLPMLMARMLGDEAEPTTKIKLFNVCFEYSVPTILALTGLDVNAEPADVVADMAKSIADIAMIRGKISTEKPTTKPNGSHSTKRTNVALLVHDSAIGLKPEGSSAKGLLVLTDAKFSTQVPLEASVTASLELAKAAMFVIDDVESGGTEGTVFRRGLSGNTTTSTRLTSALSEQGYISVASIMAAKIDAKVEDVAGRDSKSVSVDVQSQLLLVETCADSTQTLFAILGGLAPPTPPSKQLKYLTEPMTMEDMMASFTGEPEAEPDQRPETLFDVEERPGEEQEVMLDASTLGGHADDTLMASEMTESLYGPVSGFFDEADEAPEEDETGARDYGETVESLLDEDPFEMTASLVDGGMSDAALMRDLQKQCKVAANEAPIDLGLYEVEDLGFDALGAGQAPLGSRNRFNTPASRGLTIGNSKKTQQRLPFQLRLRDTHVIWNLHDGYDWQRTRDGITYAVEQVEARAEERKARRRQSLQEHDDDDQSIIGDVLFNSIYIGVPANHDVQELRRHINRGIDDLASETESVPVSGMSRPTTQSAPGRHARQKQRKRLKLERSRTHKVAFELKGVSADILVFPPDTEDVVSSVDLRVMELEIFDNVPSSTWRKFLTRLHTDVATREMSRPMVNLEILNVRTLENYAASEMVIHAALVPLRLHVDQDALDFIVRFFNFKDDNTPEPASDAEQPFIQRLEVDTVDLKLDYKPKRIDYGVLRAGNTSELMNIISLDATDIKLKHTIVYGLRGFAPLHKTLNDIWMPDVTRNQLPTVLSGLAPVRSLANIGAGMRDVVAIPVREYRKDGRLVRSIQKGALHFGKTTTSELARLGAKLAMGTQTLLSGAEGFLSAPSASPSGRPGLGRGVSPDHDWQDMTSGESDDRDQRPAISAYANQPLGVFSGLRSARRYLEHDLLTARDAFIAVQGEVLESSSPGAVAAAVARGAPTVILRPVIGASRAVGTALLGVGNQIDRGNVRKAEDVSATLCIFLYRIRASD